MSIVLHLDADSFFASVEQYDDPRLAGRAVLVGGLGGRSVVASASLEAKKRGARSAMPMEQARRMVGPHIVVTPRIRRYSEVSRELFGLVAEHAGPVEQLSIDEAFLHVPPDVHPPTFAHRLVRDVLAQVGMSVSIGGGTTKLIAKLASTATKKERGAGSVMILAPEDELTWIADMPVTAIPGVGPATAASLRELGITLVKDLRTASPRRLVSKVGKAHSVRLVELAHNRGPSSLELDRERKQISNETTFEVDLATAVELHDVATRFAGQLAKHLDRDDRLARTFTVKLRDHEFQTVTRSSTLQTATTGHEPILATAIALTDDAWSGLDHAPVRLFGLAASNFSDHQQLFLDLAPTDEP